MIRFQTDPAFTTIRSGKEYSKLAKIYGGKRG